jgi:hypothetical protein
MKTFLLALTLLFTQILCAQVYTTADEIPAFPGCENSTNKCECNQSQLLIIGETSNQIAQIEMIIDGNGIITSWRVINTSNIDVLEKVEATMTTMKYNFKLSPARINGKPVNYQMTLKLPILSN